MFRANVTAIVCAHALGCNEKPFSSSGHWLERFNSVMKTSVMKMQCMHARAQKWPGAVHVQRKIMAVTLICVFVSR